MATDLLSGGREPVGPEPESRPPRRWVRLVLAAVVILAVVGVGVRVYGHRSGAPEAAPAPSTSTDPGFGTLGTGRAMATLLVLSSSPVSVDLATGRRTPLDIGGANDPGSVQQAVSLDGGDVLGFARRGGGVDVLSCRPGVATVALGVARTVLDSHDGYTVWLVGTPTAQGTPVRQLSDSGVPVSPSMTVPPGSSAVAVTDGGQDLVLSVGSGPAQRLVVDQGGTLLTLSHRADVVAASTSAVVVRSRTTGILDIVEPDAYRQPTFPVLLPGRLAGDLVMSGDGTVVAAVVDTGSGSTSVAAGRTDGGMLSILAGTRTTGEAPQVTLSHDGALVLATGHRSIFVVDSVLTPTKSFTVAAPEFAKVLAY